MSEEKEIKTEQAPKTESVGNEENGQKQDADSMMLEELHSLISVVEKNYSDFLQIGWPEVRLGMGYRKAQEALAYFNLALARLNLYISKNRGIFNNLKREAGILTNNDAKLEVAETFNLVNGLQGFLNEFLDVQSELIQSESLKYVQTVVRFDKEIKYLADSSKYNRIVVGFNEYHAFRLRYGVSDIYKEIKIYKDTPYEECHNMVLYHMDNYIGGTKELKSLISSNGQNDMFVLDRFTSAFRYVYQAKDGMKKFLELENKLLTEATKIKGQVSKTYGGVLVLYVDAILESLVDVLEKALKLIDDYSSESSTAPYAIMHYDLVVKDVANRWLNESLSDPLSNGTQYADLIRQLIKSIGNTANVIAKNAAKWGMD